MTGQGYTDIHSVSNTAGMSIEERYAAACFSHDIGISFDLECEAI